MTDTPTPCPHPSNQQRSLYARGPRSRKSPYLLDAHRCMACGALLDNVQRDRAQAEPGSDPEPSTPSTPTSIPAA